MGQHDDASEPQEERLADALAFAGAGAWEYDLATERILWRENVDTLFGIEPGASAPTLAPHVERMHPDDRPDFLACMDQARRLQQAGLSEHVEFDDFRVRHSDGSVRWLRTRASVTERGTLEGVVVDVTQRRLAQEDARERANHLDAVIRACPDAIVTVDRDGRISFASDAVKEILDRGPGELIGRDADELIDEFVPADTAPERHAVSAEILSGERTENYAERWLRRPDGELLLAELHTRAILDGPGALDGGYVTVVRDITHHLRAQEELIAARDAAEAGERAKSEFLARTSHELRTPMNAVLGFAQLIEMDEDLSADTRSSVEHILSAGRHLLVLLDDVLDLARVESGRLRTASEPVDVRQVVTASVDLIRARCRTRYPRRDRHGLPAHRRPGRRAAPAPGAGQPARQRRHVQP